MRSAVLFHEHAMKLTTEIYWIVGTSLPEDVRQDVFVLVYEASKKALMHYEEEKSDRMQRRLKPSRN